MSSDGPPFITKTGKVLTDEDIQALADEAERGYDVSHLVTCPHGVTPDIRCDECYPEPFKEGWTESD